MPLETEARAEIRALLDGLQAHDGDLLEALHRVHDRYGYVSREAMEVVAEQLRLTPAHVYGVTTYYADFRTTPPPPVRLAWCSGPACRLRNGGGIRAALEAVLECRLGEDGAGGRVAFTLGQCVGTCEQAPQLWLQERVIGKLTAARAVELARALRDGADPETLGLPADGEA
jgi:NADH-quinone oxidoreductase subunit E/NADP-reducing hydrogenase subunit HndA